MKKLLGSIKKPKGESRSEPYRSSPLAIPTGDGPDAVVYREVAQFCESGAPNSSSAGDEYLHLPAIVDAAESSPSAANQAAIRIRGYLSKENYDRGYAQYNAIMLMRILTDNPGRAFTQFFDKDFVSTIKKLLREGRDSSVQQILRETLDYFEVKSNDNDTLLPLMEMWRKEKGTGARIVYPRGSANRMGPPMPPRPRGLPPPDELAARIEEAKTTARLLVQTVQSAPTNELLTNDLVKEFAERARSAQKSIQGFMNAENPHPDDETMLTLIETSEQLNVAVTKHQRAVLNARKATGGATPSPQPQDNSRNQYMTGGENVYTQSPPPPPPPQQPQRQSQQYPQYDQYQQHQQSQQYQPNQPSQQFQQQYQPHAQFQPPQQFQQQQPYQQRQEQPAALSPPIINGQGRTSPRNEHFVPPSGPPPGRPTSTVYSEYQTQPTGYKAPTATATYEVADNPFSDAATYDAPQQQNYSLFGRNPNQASRQNPPNNAYGQPAVDNPYSQPQAPSSPQRPGANSTGFTSTPSYVHRQDSAAAHHTMHGASPPADPQR